MRAIAMLAVASLSTPLLVGGCAINALGRGPSDLELQNDGSDAAQSEILREYEVVYDHGVFRRPGADPAAIAADIHVPRVDDVSSPAWSDDSYNYLSTSDDAAVVMEHPAVGFDQFAHSGTGEVVIVGTSVGVGVVAGAISWFLPTTVADGINSNEQAELNFALSGGLFAGLTLGVIVAAAYTYIVPAISTPFATPMYRQAARAFNSELEDRVVAAGPEGDAPAVPAEPVPVPETKAEAPAAPAAAVPVESQTP